MAKGENFALTANVFTVVNQAICVAVAKVVNWDVTGALNGALNGAMVQPVTGAVYRAVDGRVGEDPHHPSLPDFLFEVGVEPDG